MYTKTLLILTISVFLKTNLRAYEPIDPASPIVCIHTGNVQYIDFEDISAFSAKESEFPFTGELSFHSTLDGGPLGEVEVDDNVLGIESATEGAYLIELTYLDNGFPTILTVNIIVDDSKPITPSIFLLPVELARFEVTPLENVGVKVSWQTKSEYNADYFSVQRSLDGQNFEEIVRVKAVGNSNNVVDYNHQDKSLKITGIYYYRLEQVDKDNKHKFSQVRSIRYESNRRTLKIPMRIEGGQLSFALPKDEVMASARMTIFDLLGRVMLNGSHNYSIGNQVEVNVSNLGRGHFYVVIEVGSQRLFGQFFQ